MPSFSTVLATVTPLDSSHAATETLWRLLVCSRNVLQFSSHSQEERTLETAPGRQHRLLQLVLQYLQEQHSGYQSRSRAPNGTSHTDAVAAPFPALLHASLRLIAVAHDAEHVLRARHKSRPCCASQGVLADRALNQPRDASMPSNTDQQQLIGGAQLEAQMLRTNASLVVMQLPGLWHISPGAAHAHGPPRVLISRPHESAQPMALWKAVASALLHFHTSSTLAVRPAHSIPRPPGAATKGTEGSDVKGSDAKVLEVSTVLDLGMSVLGSVAQSAAVEVARWLYDAHSMLCSRTHVHSNADFRVLQQQLCLPPAGPSRCCFCEAFITSWLGASWLMESSWHAKSRALQ